MIIKKDDELTEQQLKVMKYATEIGKKSINYINAVLQELVIEKSINPDDELSEMSQDDMLNFYCKILNIINSQVLLMIKNNMIEFDKNFDDNHFHKIIDDINKANKFHVGINPDNFYEKVERKILTLN